MCHQQPARSFQIAGRPMPVCARCAGLYAGVLAGLVAAMAWWPSRGGRSPDRVRRALVSALGVAAVPMALTVAAEWAGFGMPAHAVRAGLAVPLGAGMGLLVAWAVRGDIA
jgi:uncharacterized membrane protein